MKTVKIMNEKHPESCILWGTNNGSITEWRWRFTGSADSHSGGREGVLWEMVSASTVSTTSSDPETLARKYMSSPQKLQRTGQHLSEGITQNPINYASCSQVTPGSHLPESLILCYRPCPTVCPRTWCVLFISCFHILRMQPTSLYCWVAAP